MWFAELLADGLSDRPPLVVGTHAANAFSDLSLSIDLISTVDAAYKTRNGY